MNSKKGKQKPNTADIKVMKQNISLLMKHKEKQIEENRLVADKINGITMNVSKNSAFSMHAEEKLTEIDKRLDSLGTGQTFLANTIDKNTNRIDSVERASEHQNRRIDEKVREFLKSKDDIFKRLKEYESKMFELWNEYQDRKDDKIAKEMCEITQTTDEIRKIKVKVIDDFLSTVSEDSLKVLHSLAQRGLELESSDLEFYGFEIA